MLEQDAYHPGSGVTPRDPSVAIAVAMRVRAPRGGRFLHREARSTQRARSSGMLGA